MEGPPLDFGSALLRSFTGQTCALQPSLSQGGSFRELLLQEFVRKQAIQREKQGVPSPA